MAEVASAQDSLMVRVEGLVAMADDGLGDIGAVGDGED